MKKDFITVTPDSGGGNGSLSVSVEADMNVSMKPRETTLNFTAAGGGHPLNR
jgi:hypothetical protein